MYKMLQVWMKRDNVEFPFVTAFRSPSNFDVPPDEVALVFVPLGYKLFKVVCSHRRKLERAKGGSKSFPRRMRRRSRVTLGVVRREPLAQHARRLGVVDGGVL